ncbi:MAG: DUF86 domain-containing protein [Nitrospinae bacterium]|nr:DUF86 domain-containing protein [Nitrospinota bacterium]
MPGKEDVIRLRHMLGAAKDALAIANGKSRGDLDAEITIRLSLVRCIEIVGEAASRLTQEGQVEFPQVPWEKIVNMRNRLIHAYYEINLDTVWNTVVDDLPPLVAELEKMLSDENAGSNAERDEQ